MADPSASRTWPSRTGTGPWRSRRDRPPAVELIGLTAGYGRIEVLHGIDLAVPAGIDVRPPRPQRRRQVHHPEGDRRPASGQRRAASTSPATTSTAPAPTPGPGRGVLDPRGPRHLPEPHRGREPADDEPQPARLSRREVQERAFARFPILGTAQPRRPAPCRAASSRCWPWPGPWPTDPALLLVDELSMGLAPLIVTELYDALGSLAADGMTVLLVEQFARTALGHRRLRRRHGPRRDHRGRPARRPPGRHRRLSGSGVMRSRTDAAAGGVGGGGHGAAQPCGGRCLAARPATTTTTAPAGPRRLVSWTTNADANAIDIVVDDAGGLAGAHPLDEVTIPEDTADFETGPFGHGLASVLWPGATGGNFGSPSADLPFPRPPSRVQEPERPGAGRDLRTGRSGHRQLPAGEIQQGVPSQFCMPTQTAPPPPPR